MQLQLQTRKARYYNLVFFLLFQVYVRRRIHGTELWKWVHSMQPESLFERRQVSSAGQAHVYVRMPLRYVNGQIGTT